MEEHKLFFRISKKSRLKTRATHALWGFVLGFFKKSFGGYKRNFSGLTISPPHFFHNISTYGAYYGSQSWPKRGTA
jgi:hypothetical protein